MTLTFGPALEDRAPVESLSQIPHGAVINVLASGKPWHSLLGLDITHVYPVEFSRCILCARLIRP